MLAFLNRAAHQLRSLIEQLLIPQQEQKAQGNHTIYLLGYSTGILQRTEKHMMRTRFMYYTKYQVYTWYCLVVSTTRVGRLYHDLDPLDPNQPSWNVVQDLYSANLAQETSARSCQLFETASIRQHELLILNRSYVHIRNISSLKDLYHELLYLSGDRSVATIYVS